MKRKHISLKTKLAAALLARGEVSYQHAKLMTADQMISLYHFDHNIYASHDGGDHFSNLTPMLIRDHREKTAKVDIPAIAKGKRIQRKQAAHVVKMFLDNRYKVLGVQSLPKLKRKWPSRPFPKRPKGNKK